MQKIKAHKMAACQDSETYNMKVTEASAGNWNNFRDNSRGILKHIRRVRMNSMIIAIKKR